MTSAKYKRFSSQNSLQNNEFDVGNIVEELKEKMNRMKFRLLDYQNKNHMLRKELLLAKKVFKKEVSADTNESFNDLLNQTDFKGRREKTMALKDKLLELQNRIKELEDDNVHRPSDGPTTTLKVDRQNLKKFQNKKMIDKELQYLLENSCHLKKKVEIWRKRNEELNKEIEVLRLELERLLEKSKEDKTVHESYRVADKDLRAKQSEKLALRNKLDMEKTRNEQLVEELAGLKEDLSMFISKTNDDKVLVDTLNNQKCYLLDLLERQKMTYEKDNKKFQDDMREIQERHVTNSHILDHLKDIALEKTRECRKLQMTIKEKDIFGETEEQQSAISTLSSAEVLEQSEPDQPPVPESDAPPDTEEETYEREIERLNEECEQHKDIFKSVKEEIEQLVNTMSLNNEKMNEWMAQLLQTRSLLAQRNAEIQDLEETEKKLQKPGASTGKKGATKPSNGPSFVEEIQKKYDVLSEEYQFLRALWQQLITSKENSLNVFTIYIEGIRYLFTDVIRDHIDSVGNEPDEPEEPSSDENEEQQSEQQR